MASFSTVPVNPRHWPGGAISGALDLNPAQFEYMLALTGFGDVWDKLEAAAKAAGDKAQYACLKAERKRGSFQQVRTFAVVAQFRTAAAQIAPEADLSDAAIKSAWTQAEQWEGL